MTVAANMGTAEEVANPAFVEEALEAYNERMQWFVDAQYGMFIHFGVYSQLGGSSRARKCPASIQSGSPQFGDSSRRICRDHQGF